MKCKLCEIDKNLIQAHIIPRAFFVAVNPDPNNPSKIITNKKDIYPKKSRIGVYDENILCGECDGKFQKYDNYAISVFRDKSIAFENLVIEGKFSGYLINPDYKLLKLFFLSMLWRAGISTHIFYSQVCLGPHEKIIKEMLMSENPGSSSDYAVILGKFDEDPELVPIIHPWKNRIENVLYYNFVFYGYQTSIRVSSNIMRHCVNELVLTQLQPTAIVLRPYRGSNYYNMAIKVAKSQRSNIFGTQNHNHLTSR